MTRSGGYGGSSSSSGGGVSESWVDENYVSIDFFNRLFKIGGTRTTTDAETGQTTTETVDVLPNDTDTTITNIGARLSLYSLQGVSALGLGTGGGGGGGGGASALYNLLDVSPNSTGDGVLNAQNGYVLTYDSTAGKWKAAPTAQAYTLPLAANGTRGGVQTGYTTDAANRNYAVQLSGEKMFVNIPWTDTNTTYKLTVNGTTNGASGGTSLGTLYAIATSDATAANQVWMRNSSNNGYEWRTLSSNAFDSTSCLPLSGGTMTGQIVRDSSGWWVLGRDNAALRQNGGSSTGWAPVLSVKTETGSWELGAISDSDTTRNKLILSYVTDTNYTGSVNDSTKVYFPTSAGTIALTSDNVASATKLQTARTLWGQRFDGTANVTGDMTDVGNITMGSSNGTYIQIGSIRLVYDSTNNALKVIKSDGTAASFYATGGVSALGINSGGAKTLTCYHFTANSSASTYWHRLGNYVFSDNAQNLVIELFSGNGFNGYGSQNARAKITIKKGYQATAAAAYSVGVSCERFELASGIKVKVVATSAWAGEVWVLCPWQYSQGDYIVYGSYSSWSHNSGYSDDTTATPATNQYTTRYYDYSATYTDE